ncbi:M20 family metallopeptidase (plasmid) [Methylobacterium sp. NMS14P]|uniref:M20 aminoacylase family protein n=1 Tax=Methylobacterium sp. NMS14P TaxID=2894310 RepID=UPI002358D1C9|nr:M20 aminoacylase family protein [Methylobacterium sp. NMS14P]WCS28728.1 M20 family metallopeptidase [Methylobacterium sp. NMS14P]
MGLHATIADPGIDPGIWAARDAFIALRRDLHRHPELAFQEVRTSGLVAERLRGYGYAVTTGLAGTGVVGVLRKGRGERRLGLRADMDALPIAEATDLPYRSEAPGRMHACGHDGHTAILLAAAQRLAAADFSGTLTLIFQPAEEIGAGACGLLEAGLFERFPVDAVYGLHNWPGVARGQFGLIAGPAMAAVDKAELRIVGRGGHGAAPHEAADPVVAASAVVLALQSIVARNVDPREAAVVTVGAIRGGEASNVIPDSVDLTLNIRSFDADVRNRLEARIAAIARHVAEGYGARADLRYRRGIPALVNHPAETAFARDVARHAFGSGRIEADFRPRMASEDFAFLLEARPGAYLFVGNGDSAPLHSALYDFDDAILAPAASLWVSLARSFLA